MGSVADKFISSGGRTANYSRQQLSEDICTAARFLAWAEAEGEIFGGESAKDAYLAFCRLLDVDAVKLRKIALGETLANQGESR